MKIQYLFVTLFVILLASTLPSQIAQNTNGNNANLSKVIDSCTLALTEDFTAVGNIRIEVGNERKFWLCNGSQLTYTGDRSTILAEANATGIITGNDNIIFVQTDGNATITGNQNKVYVDTDGTVVLTGLNNEIFESPDAISTISVGNNQTDICDTFFIDYRSAPENGCNQTSNIKTFREYNINIWPNPVQQYLSIDLNGIAFDQLFLFNTQGQLLYSMPKPSSREILDMTSFPAGFYILKLISNHGIESKKFQVVH